MMMRYSILLVLFVSLISCDTANKFQSEEENYFVKFYGEDGDHEGIDFIANDDGSFVILGNERVVGSSSLQQIYLVKVDARGMVIGEPKSYGKEGNDFAKDIERTPDGKIIVAAESQTVDNTRDVYVLLLDENLDLIKEKIVSGVLKTPTGQEADEEVNSISIISDGFIVAGSTTAVGLRPSIPPTPIKEEDKKDALHLRFNGNLDLIEQSNGLWFFTTGRNDSEDVLIKMIEINPSLYYGFGYTNTPLPANNYVPNYKYWVFNISNNASPLGYDEIFVSGNSAEDRILRDVIKSPVQSGAGYVLSGFKVNSSEESQSYILKLTNDLKQGQNNVLNEESPTELGTNVDGKTNMASLTSGGYLLLTNSKLPSNDNLNISLIKLSNTFKTEGREPIYFGGVGDDFSGSVTELPDGKIVVIGTMTLGGVTGQTKAVLMKLNSVGKLTD